MPADRPIEAGSLPTSRQAASSSASRGANSARWLSSWTYQLQMSACRAARRSIFGPPAPIMIGMRPGRGPTGRCARSRAAWYVPSKSARPARRRGTMISSASSKRPITWSSGSPNAWACLPACPEPRPKTNRPPLISSSVSTALAVIAGLRCSGAGSRCRPSLVWSRRIAPVIATLSHQPRIEPSAWRHSSSSGIQTVSNPTDSARRASSRISTQRGVEPSVQASSNGSTNPSSIDRTEPPWLLVTSSATERVLDPYAADRPTVLEILTEDQLGTASPGGDDDEGIRERQRVALLKLGPLKMSPVVMAYTADRPYRSTSARLRPGNDDPKLAGEVHVELLQDLGYSRAPLVCATGRTGSLGR